MIGVDLYRFSMSLNTFSSVNTLSSGVVGSTCISLCIPLFNLLPFRWITVGLNPSSNSLVGSIPYDHKCAVSIHILPLVYLINSK